MATRDSNRRHFRLAIQVIAVVAASVLAILLPNHGRFDERLRPEIEALRHTRFSAQDDNGYAFALGFMAAEGRDPHAAGQEVITALQAHRSRGEATVLGEEEMRAILGAPRANDGFDATLGFSCQARHRLDCADRLVSHLLSVNPDHSRLAPLLARYETLLLQPTFVETPAADLATAWPPLGEIVALGRLRLAMSLHAEPTAQFIEKAAQDLRFWRKAMRGGQRLGMKMVALAAIRNTHDFVSALMRDRRLDPAELAALRRAIRPFTREERDIGDAFLSEARAYLLSDSDPVLEPSWLTRLAMQRNATFNQYYRETIEPLRQRSMLDAREYFERKAYEPLRREFRAGPGMLYNLGGKLALSRSILDPHHFPSRVHDEDARVALLLLQAQVEEHPELDVQALVWTSEYRNPYTGEAMEYDPIAGTIGFVCLHTAFHPPELADHCALALSRGSAQ